MGMSINAINGISSFNTVNAVKFGSNLSKETIQKLQALGIDPSSIKTEKEAQKIIAQAEGENCNNIQSNNFDPNAYSGKIDVQQLFADVKELGAKVGVTVSGMSNLENTVLKIEAKINEVEKTQSSNNQQNTELRVSLNEIKSDIEELNNQKKSAFVSMDVMSTLNRFAFGL